MIKKPIMLADKQQGNDANRDPITGAPGAHPVGTGVGAAGGAVAGAAIGTIAGPPQPQTTEDKLNRDLTTFERLPEKTKELMQLKEREERTSGPEDVGDSKKKDS